MGGRRGITKQLDSQLASVRLSEWCASSAATDRLPRDSLSVRLSEWCACSAAPDRLPRDSLSQMGQHWGVSMQDLHREG